ncbi:MAG: tetratricopeptide repeat protein [Bacteroidetes bacterium]|jgi:hypothetical protein|nr:tetratricopeptide repeat protein [Bacteroidota bacterium]
MKTIYSLMSFLFYLFVVAQSSTQDSLKALIQKQNIPDSLKIEYHIQLSKTYQNENIDKSIRQLKTALFIIQNQKSDIKKAQISRLLAQNYRKKGIYDSAVNYALNAKRIFDTSSLKQEKLLTNSVLSILYRDQKYFKKALEINKANVELVKNDKLSPSLGRYYFDLGTSYRAVDSLKKAEKNYIKSMEIAQQTGFKPGENFMKLSLGQLYKVMDEYDKAEAYLKEVLPVYKRQNNKANMALIHYDLATIQSLRGNHNASIPLYEKSLELYSELGRLNFIKDINQKLFIAYNIVGDLPKAKAANTQYKIYKDSIDNRERKALIADMKTKYETDQLAAKNALNEKRAELAEAKSQRNLSLLVGSIVLIVLLSALFFFYSAKQKQAKKTALIQQELRASQKQLALEKQYRDSELKALKAQMNPHFIFNVLNSIQEFIVLNKKDLASEYLAAFAELIRSYLHFSNKGVLTLQEEVETLEKYLELEQLRFSQNFEYFINIDPSIDTESLYIPTMLVQPYVENAVKHGLFHKNGDCKLHIEFLHLDEGKVRCIIQDNGIGRQKAKEYKSKKLKKQKSFASQATASRLDLLNEQGHQKIGVDIVDLKDDKNNDIGTKVILDIPIKTQHK